MEDNSKTNKYIDDVKHLPIWLQYAVVFFAFLGTAGTLYGAWGTYIILSQPNDPTMIPEDISANATNISDIFSRYNEMKRATDQQAFLKNYLDVPVYGIGILDNISTSFGDSSTYYLHLSISGSLVSCQFSNVDEINKRRLDLLALSSKVRFIGKFTGSTMFESGRWLVSNCKFIN